MCSVNELAEFHVTGKGSKTFEHLFSFLLPHMLSYICFFELYLQNKIPLAHVHSHLSYIPVIMIYNQDLPPHPAAEEPPEVYKY